MAHSHQTTNLHDHVPYHKLTEAQGRAWCMPGKWGENVRRSMAGQLARMYPTNGCGVCSPLMKLVAYVSARGELRMLVAPFKVIPISAIANRPTIKDCPCGEYWDPEIRGPWKKRSEGDRLKYGGHHPMCQYQKDSARVFVELYRAKNGGVVLDEKGVAKRTGKQVKVRPDLMLQVQQSMRK